MALKDDILKAGLEIAARVGLAATNRDNIAAKVPCAGGSVSYHLGDAKHLRRALVQAALDTCVDATGPALNIGLRVVGWAIAERHPLTLNDKLDATLRANALRVHLGR